MQPSSAASPLPRETGIDALRALLAAQVVFHHAAITYGASGSWFYREVAPSGSPSSLFLILFTAVNQAFFMGLFFLLSGYFTPGMIERHGPRAFLRDRLIRLGLPLLGFGLLIGPFTVALAGTVRGRTIGEGLLAVWSQRGFVIGPLWFAEALLIFAALVALVALVIRPPPWSAARPFPNAATLFGAALVTALAAFALRLVWPVGTEILSLQLGYFASYVVLFAAGLAGARARWWSEVPGESARLWLVVAAIAFWALPLALALGGPKAGILAAGGWNAPAVLYAFWEPFVAWGIILGLLRFAASKRFDGARLWSTLGRLAYAVFLIHPPVLVAVSLAWRGIAAPPVLKFYVTGAVATALCFAVAALLLRIPILRRVL